MRRIVISLGCVIVAALLSPLSSGTTEAAVPGKPFTATGCEGHSDSVARLYTAGLGRDTERGGFEFWLTEYTTGRWSLPRMAAFFADSPEFQRTYGTLSQDGFIRQLYRNVLGREGEDGGVAFWNEQMDRGLDRGTVLLRFSESPENVATSSTTEPTLGFFNQGLVGPWTCADWAPGRAVPGPAGASPEDALPLGDRFAHEDRFQDVAFDGSIVRLVEGRRSAFNNGSGRCLFVLGVLTPTRLESGVVSDRFSAPDVSLIADGRRITSTAAECDWDDVERAGWRWSLDMQTTVGTGFPFFEEFFLPDNGPTTPTSIVIGNPATDRAIYFESPISTTIPAAPVLPSGPNSFLASAIDLGTGFQIREQFGGVTWDVRILHLVRTNPWFGAEGTCMLVLGTLTPTTIDNGVVTSGFDTPSVGILNRGRVIDDTGGACDDRAVESAGWGWILNAEVTRGTQFPFHVEILIEPGNTEEVQAVVVGPPSSDAARFTRIASVSTGVPPVP